MNQGVIESPAKKWSARIQLLLGPLDLETAPLPAEVLAIGQPRQRRQTLVSLGHTEGSEEGAPLGLVCLV